MGRLTAFTVDSPYVCLGKSYICLPLWIVFSVDVLATETADATVLQVFSNYFLPVDGLGTCKEDHLS